METLEAIKTRRSVRKFCDKEISQKDLLALKEAVLHSPTSRTRHTWHFYFVQNAEIIKKLSHCKEDGSSLLDGAKLAVVICGDENVCDVWIEDASVSAIILQLAAQSLGLGSCWVQVRGRKHSKETCSEGYVQNALSIPKNRRVLCIVAIGHPDETPPPRKHEDLRFDKIEDVQ